LFISFRVGFHFEKFDRTRLELTCQAPEFDFNSHPRRQVAIEADPGVHFIKKPTNAALDWEVLRDVVEMQGWGAWKLHFEEMVTGLVAVGGRTGCTHQVNTGYLKEWVHTFSTYLSLHLFPRIPLIYITLSFPVWPGRAWQATQHFGFTCPFYAAQAHHQNTGVIQQVPLLGGLQGAITDQPLDSTRGTTWTPLSARATPDMSVRDMSRSFTMC
jgi:hypothetical protein